MAESSISVCVRIRPFSEKEAALLAPEDNVLPFLGDGGLGGSPAKPLIPMPATGMPRGRFIRPIVKPMDDQVLVFDPPDNNPLSRLYSQSHLTHGGKRSKDMRYAFDRVFNSACTQGDVFEQTCKPLMDGILNGYNASVFAYGATGCGKTHTISGSPEDPGLIFLTMKELYQRIDEARADSEVYIRLSYLEIYNETIRDLLSAEPTPPGQGLALREDANNKISVVGITELVPESPETVLDIIQEGNARRTMSPTEANAVSSRSHAVLQINVTQKPRTADTTDETTSASLNIIDLAGSERASATRNNGARMKEGANINKSLLALGNCINALCQSGGLRKHVPYRNSKLTRLLKFSLGGNCKTVMIVCVSPSSAHYEETHNALKYANQAKNIRTKVSRNMINVDRHVAQYVQTIAQLKEEVAELKRKLSEKGSYESAAEKRKRAEAAQELVVVKNEISSKTENVRRLVREKAGFEAQIAAAEVRSIELRRRLDEVEAELGGCQARKGSSPTIEVDSEAELLEGERNILRQLLQRQESIIRSPELKAGADGLENSLTMHRGLLMVASQNQKFDVQAAEIVKSLGESVRSVLDSARAQTKYDAALAVLRDSSRDLARLVSVAAKSTVALRDVAGQLEYETGELNKGGGAPPLASRLAELAAQMRGLADANNLDISDMAGSGVLQQASVAGRPMRTGASTVLRRARRSFGSAQPGVGQPGALVAGLRSASVAAPARAAGPPRTGVRRASLAPGGSRVFPSSPTKPAPSRGVQAPPATAAPARAHFASSPRKTNRRLSVGLRRVSAVGLGNRPPPPPVEPAPQAKKAFRWADEAGEGSIDDKGKRAVPPTGSAESLAPAPPLPPAGLGAASAGVGDQVPPHRAPARQPASRLASDVEAEDSSSGTDWEDYGSATSSASPAAADASDGAAKPVAKRAAGMFDRNFLAKRAAAKSSSSSALGALQETEDDDGDQGSEGGLGRPTIPGFLSDAASAPREPFGELANRSLPTTASTLNLSGAKFNSERRGPYSRQSLSGPGSGVGPVRRKARVSSINSSGPLLPSTSASPLPPQPAAPRTASGPPNNTAARLARRASSLTVNLSLPTPGNPLGRPHGIAPSRSGTLGSIGEDSFNTSTMGKRTIR